jgi:hypothetical protein
MFALLLGLPVALREHMSSAGSAVNGLPRVETAWYASVAGAPMAKNRVFVPQETLDEWLSNERVEVDGETMTLKPEGQRFQLKTAVRFVSEVAGGGDAAGLVGKVKDLDQLGALGGEHCADSVVLGDDAYQVLEGFVGEPIIEPNAAAAGSSLAAAARAAAGDDPATVEIDLLARFFLSSS